MGKIRRRRENGVEGCMLDGVSGTKGLGKQ